MLARDRRRVEAAKGLAQGRQQGSRRDRRLGRLDLSGCRVGWSGITYVTVSVQGSRALYNFPNILWPQTFFPILTFSSNISPPRFFSPSPSPFHSSHVPWLALSSSYKSEICTSTTATKKRSEYFDNNLPRNNNPPLPPLRSVPTRAPAQSR